MDQLRAYCVQICEEIRLYLDGLTHCSQDVPNQTQGDSLSKCGPAVTNLLCRQARIACQGSGDWRLMQKRLDDLISLAKDRFYAHPFKEVPECWRRLFTDASIIRACSELVQNRRKPSEEPDDSKIADSTETGSLDSAIKILDLAIIMAGAPGMMRRVWIEKIMEHLELLCKPSLVIEECQQRKRQKLDREVDERVFPTSTVFLPVVTFPIAREVSLSYNAFEKYMEAPRDPSTGSQPLIMEKIIEHWPARNENSWNRPFYLLSKTLDGRRLVPVEIGRSYVDAGWGQKVISFKEFMTEYLLRRPSSLSGRNEAVLVTKKPASVNISDDNFAESSRTGYLAQHDLFTQIPSLRADITIPDYCYTSPPLPHPSSPLAAKHLDIAELEEPLLNAWLGPAGTISPMHVDPYHNILAQVVGKKYIRLYAPRESAKLYPRGIEDGGVDMCNTSALDIGVLEGWDGTKKEQEEARQMYPLYKRAQYVDAILEDGQCLYIPLGWWHYVRSLSVSFSVSFWWN